ncbi:MAG: TIGR03084 family metal-binding protein [Pseudooceanicola sp.]
MIAEAQDFLDETRALHALTGEMAEDGFDRPTAFKGWSTNDVLQHLHHYNILADLSLFDPERFAEEYGKVQALREQGLDMVAASREMLGDLAGAELRAAWLEQAEAMAPRWHDADPATRVDWAGPSMSARSSISARLMETWAHGQEIWDLAGRVRADTDRIRSIAVLGVNTFGWTFKARGEAPPGERPTVRLSAPSGEEWTFPGSDEEIGGSATEFCQVVTQTRNIADVALRVEGPVAREWMAKAQCFAGPPNPPPAPGTRGPGVAVS